MIEDQPWVGLLIGLAAMTPFTVQCALFVRNQRRERSWVATTAVVLHTDTNTNSEGVRTYLASYAYTDPSGHARSGRAEIDHEAAHGTELSIIHDPSDPRRSQPRRRVGAGHWIAGGLGLLLFAAGLFGVAQSVSLMTTGQMLGE